MNCGQLWIKYAGLGSRTRMRRRMANFMAQGWFTEMRYIIVEQDCRNKFYLLRMVYCTREWDCKGSSVVPVTRQSIEFTVASRLRP